MGISMVVTVPSTLVLAAYVACRDSVPPYISYPLLQASLVGFAAAVSAYPAVNYTALFGKTSEGSFPLWSYAAFYPYLLTLRGYVILRRLKSKEPVYTEIKNGLFVGGWPWLQADVPPGSPAVVDCTCELPRSSSALPLPYLCIPTWDTRGPRPSDIELAVRWAVKRRSQNLPVYIHCAFGHGRSVTVMCALLVALGEVATWEDALVLIKSLRPRARLNKQQRESLLQWSKSWGSKHVKDRTMNALPRMQSNSLSSRFHERFCFSE